MTRLVLLAVGAAAVSAPAEPPLETGRVVRSLPTRADPQQTYAYYLPTAYDPSRRWPILYCFDPAARGGLPVELFAEAAQRRGYLVVGSNNSRNGPMAASSAAATALWRDTHERFAIDGARVYAAGFSGGSRAASRFGQALGLAGVIGAGAGLALGMSPAARVPFAYYGAVGRDDFNFFEMLDQTDALAGTGAEVHLEIFEGDHAWPPREVAARALEWMDLRAMRARRIPGDPALVERFVSEARARLAARPKGSDERYRLLQTTVADLRGLTEVADLEAELEALRGSKAIETARRHERRMKDDQTRSTTELLRLEAAAEAPGSARPEPAEDPDILRARLRAEIERLVKRATASEPSDERTLARRTLYGFSVICGENAAASRRANDLDLALGHLFWVAATRPEAAWPRVEMAALTAIRGDRGKALRLLREAVDRGYADADSVEKDDDFARLRGSAEFRALVERMRAAAKP